jgi:small subunit ribosomal protein S9
MMADEETPDAQEETPDAQEETPEAAASIDESTDELEQTTDALEASTDKLERTTDTLEDSTDTLEQTTAAISEPGEEPAASAESAQAQPADAADAGADTSEEEPAAPQEAVPAAADEAEEEQAAPAKPSVPGAHLEVDIVPEGVDPLGKAQTYEDPYAVDDEESEQGEKSEDDEQEALVEPISTAAIDLAAGARYRATGKRKTAIARVTLRPGSGTYLVNGRTLEEHFPRVTLQRNIRQPLETVGYEERMDVVARLHGGGISAQAGALRHGVSRALLEADPNLRGELKRRGFLTRDSRAKERKKAGLKKARKRPQFSKR